MKIITTLLLFLLVVFAIIGVISVIVLACAIRDEKDRYSKKK